MQKFLRQKSQDEIRQACLEAGFALDTTEYNKGSDFVKIIFFHDGQRFEVSYCSFNGRFFGKSGALDADGTFFTESCNHDEEPWYQALLNFLYVAQEPGL